MQSRVRNVALAVAITLLGSGAFAVTTWAATPVAHLAVGQSAFWNGAYVTDAYTDLPGAAACAVEQCYSYPVPGHPDRARPGLQSLGSHKVVFTDQ